MAMREGTGKATVEVKPATAFAYLADPRNAPEWFAGVAFAQSLEEPPHEGMTWSFVQTQSGGRVVPVRMQVYAPPARFVWSTQLRWPQTNLVWEARCEPADDGGEGTRLAFTIRIEPGPLGWLTLLAGAPFSRGAVARRAQRAVDRARVALLQGGPPPGQPRRRTAKGKRRPGKRRSLAGGSAGPV